MRPRIAITMGDPAGVGPEVVAHCLDEEAASGAADPGKTLVVGSTAVLRSAAERSRLALRFVTVEGPEDLPRDAVGVVDVTEGEETLWRPGHPDSRGARLAGRAVERAAGLALAARVDALVTAPLTKRAFAEIGSPSKGHTEYLAALAGVDRFAMMFVFGGQRVLLATTHLPLAEVPRALSGGRIRDCVRLLDETLRADFDIDRPRLGVAGLNPHAGEDGLLGPEENEFVRPAVEACWREGVDVSGPHPADTLFRRMRGGEFDGVVALYHDQGLIPVKLEEPERAVNVTVGLPFVRTSASHGTGFDIAGTGRAQHAGMREALRLADRLGSRRMRETS